MESPDDSWYQWDKKNYIEFEAQLNAYVMYKGSQIAFKPIQSADYFPQGEILLSDNETRSEAL